MPAELAFFYTPDRQVWRQWLADHHDSAPGVWFVFYKKKTGTPSLTYDEAVEEALCYGWVDSLPKKVDEERHALKFSPRKPKSVWSKPNKDRVERLVANGLMTPTGLTKIERAKQDGSWDALNDSDALLMPADLDRALAADGVAAANFNRFSPGSRKIILSWIGAAKRPETRASRIAETVRLAALGKRANFPADR
ncbi:YdeI/OmpD-associated family protein [Fibrella sp. HMF5335]|uniref:YdeI/OmpD-associated family protein n=1 Tax=Fibrella rubiginis TaxID=2817060 RepID=A0A939GIU5_9BACT|nr:YdeI/OmpD-associated family protein [Fibrella rubiginis]MBO0939106.1 YdeI/OmpD-associated family protein [Fibrella rubiginis]